MNIGTLLAGHGRYRPDRLALVADGERLSYRQFNRRVERLAGAVRAAGVGKGDKVAAVLPNCLELMSLYWAAAKAGFVIVPASTLLEEAGLAALLDDSDSTMVFAAASFAGVLGKIGVERVVLVGEGAGGHAKYLSYDALIAGAPEDGPPDPVLSDDDVFNIMYTSGTTGAPKGIVHTHYVRAMYCTLFASAFRMRPESVVLHAGSIVFNGAMIVLMPWMYLGCTYVMHAAFDAEAVLRDMAAEKATHMVMVPAQIAALLNHPGFDPAKLQSLEMILSVGAPLLMEYKQRLNEALPGRFYELYGLTEGFATVLDCTDSMRKAGSVGVPVALSELRIADAEGNQCLIGETGEIWGRGPFLMPGYYQRPDLTAQAIVDGWLRTGDAGYVDEDGFLFLVDRIKDMIISGGVNVYPKDIEEVIVRHPDVAEVAVFGVPDDKWGEAPVAAVIARDGANIDTAELVEWTNRRVAAKFQRIRHALVMETFPRNIAAKTLKREIRELYLDRA